MKQTIISILMVVFTISLCAQETETISKSEKKKLAKEEKKAQKAAEKEKSKALTKYMMESHRFVLEANMIGNKYGQRTNVSSTLNFIAVDSLRGVIQIGTYSGAGWNGVGGVTVEGNITQYDLKIIQGKKSISYSLMLIIMTSSGIFDISLNVSETGMATATVRSTTRGELNYSGNLVPIYESGVFKGTTRY